MAGRNKIDFSSDYQEVFQELNKLDFFFSTKSPTEGSNQASDNKINASLDSSVSK
jgi:hypothetical protein